MASKNLNVAGLIILSLVIVLIVVSDKITHFVTGLSPEVAEARAKEEEKKAADYSEIGLLNNLPHKNDFYLGDKNAKVAIVEYASLTCPHCAKFHNEVVPVIDEKYIKTGKVLYILRPYPLNEPAMKASQLLNCVGAKDGSERYYSFAKVLFESQKNWAFENDFIASLKPIFNIGGVSAEDFDKCIADVSIETKIIESVKKATDELKIDHTPTVFINGKQPKEVTVNEVTDAIEAGLK